jgi:hypothetical protein
VLPSGTQKLSLTGPHTLSTLRERDQFLVFPSPKVDLYPHSRFNVLGDEGPSAYWLPLTAYRLPPSAYCLRGLPMEFTPRQQFLA